MAKDKKKRNCDSNGNLIPRKMENGLRNMRRRGVVITKEKYESIWKARTGK